MRSLTLASLGIKKRMQGPSIRSMNAKTLFFGGEGSGGFCDWSSWKLLAWLQGFYKVLLPGVFIVRLRAHCIQVTVSLSGWLR